MASPFWFLTGNDAARMYGTNAEQNNLYFLPVAYYATYCVSEERSRSSHVCSSRHTSQVISSFDDSVMRYNGGLFWVELKSRCEAPINEKFERRARKRATGHDVINTRYNTQCTCSDSAEV